MLNNLVHRLYCSYFLSPIKPINDWIGQMKIIFDTFIRKFFRNTSVWSVGCIEKESELHSLDLLTSKHSYSATPYSVAILLFYFLGYKDHDRHLWSNAWCHLLGWSRSLPAWALSRSWKWKLQKFWADDSIRLWQTHLYRKYASAEWALSFSGSFSAAFWVFRSQSQLTGASCWICSGLSGIYHEDSRKNLNLLKFKSWAWVLK